ncbi:MAG TPA: hypothetical protein VL049_18845 [Candidatus Dormibacteraeota bacterium]|nr:hypothetical protein [Candidatus Dormibacteraeota bacterium]
MTKMATSATMLEGDSVAGLAHMLAGGEMVGAQRPAACVWSPEKSLAAAVLASALVEIRDHSGDPKHAAAVADELAWVRADTVDRLYTFRRLCELLNLEPQWVREVVERWHAAGRRRRALLSSRVAA